MKFDLKWILAWKRWFISWIYRNNGKIHLLKKVYNLDFWWFLYHPFFVWPFCDTINTQIEANQDIFPSATDRRSWSLLFVAEFVCDELKPSEEREGLKGGTVLGVLRFFQFLKQFTGDTSRFLRILFLVFLIFEYSQAAMVMPWRMTLPAATFWYVSTCFHILQPCLNKLHFIGYHLGTSLVMKTSWTNFRLGCRCVVAFWCIEIVKWMNTLGIDAECPGWSRFHLGIWRALPLPLCWHHAVLRAPTLVVLFFTETYTLQLWYGEHVFRNGRSTGMTSSFFSHST